MQKKKRDPNNEKLIFIYVEYRDGTTKVKRVKLIWDPETAGDFKNVGEMLERVESSLLEADTIQAFEVWTSRLVKVHKTFKEDLERPFDPLEFPAAMNILKQIADGDYEIDDDLDKDLLD